ncbi:hypothetical protein [Salinithrix halophila]|uniref:Uncharacterized protein n=1 Tax=Salinithrix halophila TaxID=1485204 RepID=A0ABV8JEW0_9BACL
MITYLLGLVSAGVWTGYLVLLIRRRKEELDGMTAMVTAMATGTLSGLLIGTVLGVWYGQMTAPTVYASLAGSAGGYQAGKPIRFSASLEGLLSGIMGGAMGAMLGVMIREEAPIFLVGMIHVIFVVAKMMTIGLIHCGSAECPAQIRRRFIRRPWPILWMGTILVIALWESSFTDPIPFWQQLFHLPPIPYEPHADLPPPPHHH